MTIAAARGTQGTLFTLLQNDFTGSNSFVWWSASIVGIGSVGYIKEVRPLANTFLALVLLVLILKNGGVFSKFVEALRSGTNVTPVTPAKAA